jgi:hypothetical protein
MQGSPRLPLTQPWHYFLIETLIAVLPGMAVLS